MLVGQHSMGVTDTVRHGSKQVIYEGYPEFGYNHRLTDLHAAIGVSNCNGFPTRHAAGAAQYGESAFDIAELETPAEPCWTRSNWQSYCVKLPYWFDQRGRLPGKGRARPLPYCDTEAMREHVAEISRSVDGGAHAVLILIRPDRM